MHAEVRGTSIALKLERDAQTLTHPDGDVIGDELSSQNGGARTDCVTEHSASKHTEHIVTQITMKYRLKSSLFSDSASLFRLILLRKKTNPNLPLI